MFPPPPPAAPGSRPLPDFTIVHKELKSRQNVTLQLLWEEHHQAHPEGYNYSCYVAAVFMLRDHLKAMTVPGTVNAPAT
jgi:transposase